MSPPIHVQPDELRCHCCGESVDRCRETYRGMSATTAPSYAIIEVPAFGMRLRVVKDEGSWKISGWRRVQGRKAMVMFAATDAAPTFTEDDDDPCVVVGRTYISLPTASQLKLQAFIASTEGPSGPGGAA